MSDSLPNVGRPRGSAWRKLQDEGVVWEGQVLIPGDEVDLAALMIVTQERVAVVRGGAIALDIPRDWLSPAPSIRRTGSVLLQISMPETTQPEPLTIIAREGRPAAADLVTVLTAPPPAPAPPPVSKPKPKLRYVPEAEPEPLPVPLAKPHRPNRERPMEVIEPEEFLPGFQMLDLDDFPPVKPGERQPEVREPVEAEWPAWGQPIPEPEPEPRSLPPQVPGSIPLPLKPLSGFETREERTRRGLIIRLGGLVLLLAAIGVFSSGILPSMPDITNPFSDDEPEVTRIAQVPDEPDDRTPDNSVQVEAPTPTPTQAMPSQATGESDHPTVVPEETAEALGVGGLNPTNTPEPTPTDVPAPTSTSTPEPTATRTPVPTETPAPAPTEGVVIIAQATEEPTATATATTSPTPTDEAEIIIPVDTPDEPAEEQIEDPTATLEPEPTETPEAEPTEEGLPSTTDLATPGAENGASPALTQQEASVGSGESPAQTFVTGQLRMSIQAAYLDQSIPDLTLGGLPNDNWLVLVVDAINWSGDPAQFEMANFRLETDAEPGVELPLDETTGAISTYLRFNPSTGANDTVVVAVGGTQRLALVFVVPVDATGLTLLAGDARIDLTEVVGPAGDNPRDLPELAAMPELLEGTVVAVESGVGAQIDVEGGVATVLYLGVAVPGVDSCYGPEALAMNQELVEGQTVWLERQRRNSAGQSAYGRDVWVATPDGERQLVAAELVRDGAAEPAPAEPDTRFAGWLAGEATAAEQAGAGLWSECA
jgi:hypothetical protein